MAFHIPHVAIIDPKFLTLSAEPIIAELDNCMICNALYSLVGPCNQSSSVTVTVHRRTRFTSAERYIVDLDGRGMDLWNVSNSNI